MANGAVVANSNVIWQASASFPPADYVALVYQNASATDPTSVWFDHVNSTTLDAAGWNVDESTWWYRVGAGQDFSAATIPTGIFPKVLTHDGPSGEGVAPAVTIPVGTFYMGFHTFRGQDTPWGLPTVYGWVRLNNTGTQITMVSNAVAYDARGIIVGTTTVPEPALSGALLCSAALLLRRRPTC